MSYLSSFVDGLKGFRLFVGLRVMLCNDGFEFTDGLLVFDALHFLHVPHQFQQGRDLEHKKGIISLVPQLNDTVL